MLWLGPRVHIPKVGGSNPSTATKGETMEHNYEAALHAAMLYAQSVVQDSANGYSEPSAYSNRLLKELTTTHKEAILKSAEPIIIHWPYSC